MKDSCSGTTFVDYKGITHENVYVHMKYEISINKGDATLNIDDKKLILENGPRCDYSDEKCFDPIYGSTFWSVGLTTGLCDTKPLFLFYKGEVNKTIEYKKDNTTKISYMNVDSNQLFYIEAVRKTRLVDFLLTFHNIQVFILLKSWITIKNSYAIDHSALKISIPQFCMVCNSLCCIMM